MEILLTTVNWFFIGLGFSLGALVVEVGKTQYQVYRARRAYKAHGVKRVK